MYDNRRTETSFGQQRRLQILASTTNLYRHLRHGTGHRLSKFQADVVIPLLVSSQVDHQNFSSYIIELLQLHDTIQIEWNYAWIHYNIAIRSHLMI